MPDGGAIANDLITKASGYIPSMSISYSGNEDQSVQKPLDTTNDVVKKKDSGALFKLFTLFRRNLINQYIRNITNVVARIGSYR